MTTLQKGTGNLRLAISFYHLDWATRDRCRRRFKGSLLYWST
jgi:hypothetical protein